MRRGLPTARTLSTWTARVAAASAGAYAIHAALAWLRYGHPPPGTDADRDALLDRVMPNYDVVERHHIRVDAPAHVTFAAACEMDVQGASIAKAIFRAREVLLGAEPDTVSRPQGLVALTGSLGWGVLAEEPGREIVMGAVTRPWNANVVFRALPPDGFRSFDEPNYVKIAWTLRADPVGTTTSVFRTETRAVATDGSARAKFRRYWALLSPGIVVIRWAMLRPLKTDAERRFSAARAASPHVDAGTPATAADRLHAAPGA